MSFDSVSKRTAANQRLQPTAAALHGIDKDLAQRCRLKGEYWTDPDAWDERQLEEAKILLKQVAADADTLLGWKESSGRRLG